VAGHLERRGIRYLVSRQSERAGLRPRPAGPRARGHITHPGYEHLFFEVVVERIEPPQLLSFRWHPYAVDTAIDYSQEEPTLVTFTLGDAAGNATVLTVVESGFDKLPPERRLEAFRMNSGGWAAQMENVVRHVGT
jgi:uncharacterized protein YndB with AHSA1/START domain